MSRDNERMVIVDGALEWWTLRERNSERRVSVSHDVSHFHGTLADLNALVAPEGTDPAEVEVYLDYDRVVDYGDERIQLSVTARYWRPVTDEEAVRIRTSTKKAIADLQAGRKRRSAAELRARAESLAAQAAALLDEAEQA